MIITPPIPGPAIEVSTPADAAAELIGRSSVICRMAIVAEHDEDDQRNAALYGTDEEKAAIAAHVQACRATHHAFKAAVIAVLDTPGDDAAKMVALEALNS